MIVAPVLSEKSLTFLHKRQLSASEINDFQAILMQAKEQTSSSTVSSKSLLNQMSDEQLSLLKKANALAHDIDVASLSEEGATNLLRQPDHSDRVDLNNDGIVEVGAGKTLVFPPVNAPAAVKAAWQQATAGMHQSDVLQLELHMHIAVFGIQIGDPDQAVKASFDPQQQWSTAGINSLFTHLRSALDFRVQQQGWTEHNMMLEGFYNRFEQALKHPPKAEAQPELTASGNDQTAPQSDQEQAPAVNPDNSQDTRLATTRLAQLLQASIDARLGLDRKTLDEIDAKMAEIAANQTLDKHQKQQLLEQLETLKAAIVKSAEQKMVEDEKRKTMLATPGLAVNSETRLGLTNNIDKPINYSLNNHLVNWLTTI